MRRPIRTAPAGDRRCCASNFRPRRTCRARHGSRALLSTPPRSCSRSEQPESRPPSASARPACHRGASCASWGRVDKVRIDSTGGARRLSIARSKVSVRIFRTSQRKVSRIRPVAERRSVMHFLKRFVLVSLAMALMLSPLSAQCVDPAKHFRGGVLRHWIFQLTPGAAALAAVHRIENEINTARAGANLPLLVFDPEEPVQVAVWEENNPRGPDGANLPDRMPNQQISLVTFAELPGAFDGEVAVFLTDPFRSNASLTAKGVPGVGATFSR